MHVVNQRRYSTAFFVQDDWRVTEKLTLNLGLRYDFMTPSYEKDNRQANFDPATGTLVYASDGSLEDRALVKPDRNNVAPRIGVVFALDDKTVLRGGYGMFYNPIDRIGSEDQVALNPPGPAQHQPADHLDDGAGAGHERGLPGQLPRPGRTSC